MPLSPTTALVAASFLHLGFQTVVTLLVYPTFARVPSADWPTAHSIHTRRIGPIVAVVYGALAIAVGRAVVTGPSVPEWVAVAAAAVAVLVTAAVAAPAHARLSPDRPAHLLARLIRADRVRLGAAVVGAAAAVVAATGTAG